MTHILHRHITHNAMPPAAMPAAHYFWMQASDALYAALQAHTIDTLRPRQHSLYASMASLHLTCATSASLCASSGGEDAVVQLGGGCDEQDALGASGAGYSASAARVHAARV